LSVDTKVIRGALFLGVIAHFIQATSNQGVKRIKIAPYYDEQF